LNGTEHPHGGPARFRRALPVLIITALTFVPALAIVALGIAAHRLAGVPFSHISDDPMYTMSGHPLTGGQSTAGVLIWWAGAAISIFAAALLRCAGQMRARASFLFWAGVLTAILVIDDQFMIHDDLAQRHLGIPQTLVTVSLGLLALGLLVRFRSVIRTTPWPLLIVAFAFLGSMAFLDFLNDRDVFGRDAYGSFEYAEDVLKLLGISAWSAYFIRLSLASVRAALPRSGPVKQP
jgi:hypothetical protein